MRGLQTIRNFYYNGRRDKGIYDDEDDDKDDVKADEEGNEGVAIGS